jgi:uncharacterized Ntn-hydrolase superfamily protein
MGRPTSTVPIATFSIVACDRAAGELGVAVQSKFLAVGAVVPWARAGIGAVATQAWGNPAYGPDGLAFLAAGLSPADALDRLTAADPEAALRQAGIVDAQGRAATYTGSGCTAWAGGRTGPGYAAQGNILVSGDTVDAIAGAFESTRGALAGRLLAALDAGQAAGGDSRGMQSAALLVVREGGGYGGQNDRYIDLRVDDHATPIAELRRLYELHTLYFPPAGARELLPIDAALCAELQEYLSAGGDYTARPPSGTFDAATSAALRAYMGRENLEERMTDGAFVDAVVLRYMREHH